MAILQMKASIYHKSNDCCFILPRSRRPPLLINITFLSFIQTNAMFQSTLKSNIEIFYTIYHYAVNILCCVQLLKRFRLMCLSARASRTNLLQFIFIIRILRSAVCTFAALMSLCKSINDVIIIRPMTLVSACACALFVVGGRERAFNSVS